MTREDLVRLYRRIFWRAMDVAEDDVALLKQDVSGCLEVAMKALAKIVELGGHVSENEEEDVG